MGLPLVLSGYREQKILKRLKVTPASPVMLLAVQYYLYDIFCNIFSFDIYCSKSVLEF